MDTNKRLSTLQKEESIYKNFLFAPDGIWSSAFDDLEDTAQFAPNDIEKKLDKELFPISLGEKTFANVSQVRSEAEKVHTEIERILDSQRNSSND